MKKFLAIAALMFAAELPDKSAFAGVLLATRNNPWAVFIGSALGFAVHSVLAVAFGSLLGMLPVKPVQIGAGAMFLLMGLIMIFRRRDGDDDEASAAEAESSRHFGRQIGTAFAVIFFAEWGDLTQFAIAAVAARERAPIMVLSASLTGIWSVCAIGTLIGTSLKKAVSETLLEKCAGVLFVMIGIIVLFRAVKMNYPL